MDLPASPLLLLGTPIIHSTMHVCSGFRPEEREDGAFVIFCEAPPDAALVGNILPHTISR